MPVATLKSDADLHQDILREIRWDSRVNQTEVGVQVKDGIVTLTGTVNSYAKRLAAAEAAHRVHGVLDVANDIQVKVAGIGRKTDTEIAEAIRSALKWDVFLPDEKIQTTVSDGWVTLAGEVDTWAHRLDAERAIQRLTGVTGVTNNIKIKVPEADPNRLRESIESALNRRAEREAARIGVSVRDGVVALTGVVRSWGEKHAVEQVAGYAPGIRRLDSALTVDPYM